MKPARILLIVVALIAGGMAALLTMRGNNTPAPQQAAEIQVREEPKMRVLVAANAIGLGQRLTAGDVVWQDWPQGAVRSEYITSELVPDAPQQVAGAVARFEFFPGEPIREAKLVNSEQGYLSAVITEGMRGVSIPVSAASASGGYIVPNDRVDVVLTRNGADYSETILNNVRVLAIGKRLGEMGTTSDASNPQEPTSQVFDGTQIATLELTPAQAEVILNAALVAESGGKLALVLRSVIDFARSPGDDIGSSQAVRLIRYGQTKAVMSGTTVPATSATGGNATLSALGAQPDVTSTPGALPPAQQPTVQLR